MASGPFAATWAERIAPEITAGSAVARLAAAIYDEITSYDAAGAFSSAGLAVLRRTVIEIFDVRATVGKNFGSSDLVVARNVLNLMANAKILDASDGSFAQTRKRLAEAAETAAAAEQAAGAAAASMAADTLAEAKKTAGAMIAISEHTHRAYVSEHAARLDEVVNVTINPAQLRTDLAEKAMEGELEQNTWAVFDLALRQPDVLLKDSKLYAYINNFVCNGCSHRGETFNVLAVKTEQDMKKFAKMTKCNAHHVPLLSHAETGKLSQLRAVMDNILDEFSRPPSAGDALELVSGGAAPKNPAARDPFGAYAKRRAQQIRDLPFPAGGDDGTSGAKVTNWGDEQESRVEYWVPVIDASGTQVLSGDFTHLCHAIIEMRRDLQITKRGVARLHTALTHYQQKVGARLGHTGRGPRGGGEQSDELNALHRRLKELEAKLAAKPVQTQQPNQQTQQTQKKGFP